MILCEEQIVINDKFNVINLCKGVKKIVWSEIKQPVARWALMG